MHAMVGNRSGETHRLGDRVTVKLVEAAPVAGALRFELLSEGRVMTGAQRRPSDRPGSRAHPEHRREKKPFRGKKPYRGKRR
jgi:ribonuclease R